MANKILAGKDGGETITYEEAKQYMAAATDEVLGYLIDLVDKATDDEEDRAQAKVNISAKLNHALSMAMLTGLLRDPDEYLEDLRKVDPMIRIEENPNG